MRGDAHVRFGGRAGETDRPKGRHRAPARPIPADWTDEQTTAHIQGVARNPDHTPEYRPNGRWKVHGQRDRVDIIAIVTPDAQIWTAYPMSRGPGVVKNPKRGKQ